jgi:aminopeptidase N
MRPKVVFGVLLLGFGLLGVFALVSEALRPQPPHSAKDGNALQTAPNPGEPRVTARSVPNVNLVSTAASTGTADGEATAAASEDAEHGAYVQRRIDELNALAMQDDPVAHDAILSELGNPDKEIRHAALEAAIQAHDQSTIPRLQDFATATADAEEKAAALEAIKWINMPSLADSLAAQDQNPPTNSSSNQSPAFRRFRAMMDASRHNTAPDKSSQPPQIGP